MLPFNEHLRTIRKDKGFTQRQVAIGSKITERNYQYYESGEREPSMTTLIALADYFNVPLDYLVGRGIFENWNEILANKDKVEAMLLHDFHFACEGLTDEAFLHIMYAIVKKIEFSDNAVSATYYIELL